MTRDPAGPPPGPPPGTLDAVALASRLAPRWRVEVVATSPSTNADLAHRVRHGGAGGAGGAGGVGAPVLVAEHQTAGRGRLDRTWTTPPRVALTFSAVLDPGDVVPERWPWLPLLVGVSVADGVRRATGHDAVLKWPNDLLAGGEGPEAGRKLAGVLLERVEGPEGPRAVAGVGLNVTQSCAELPHAGLPHAGLPGADPPRAAATSLALVDPASHPDRGRVLVAVLGELARRLEAWSAARGDPDASGLRTAYVARCDTVGREVRVDLPRGERRSGLARGVDARGRLEVATPTGVRAFGAGDVVHVRTARPGPA